MALAVSAISVKAMMCTANPRRVNRLRVVVEVFLHGHLSRLDKDARFGRLVEMEELCDTLAFYEENYFHDDDELLNTPG